MNSKRKLSKVLLVLLAIVIIMAGSGVIMGAPKVPTLRVVLANHPWLDVIKPLIPEFEKATGLKINLESYEENQLTPKLTVEFTSGTSSIDVFMTRPLQEGRLFSRNNWYQPLDKYINKKDAVWNFDDYPQASIQAVTYLNKLYALPLVTEWHVVFYRKDLFEKAKLNPPTTLEELEAAAKILNNPSADIYGIVSRGQRGAAVTQFSSYLYNFGGDFIKNGKCVIDSPEAIKAFKFYGKMLHDYGPPGVTNMGWPQAQALFASGKAAMWTDASVLITGIIAPDKSKVADVVGVAPFPAGPAGNHPYMILPWAICMSAQSKNKNLAWTFIEWASSPEMTKKAQLSGLTMSRSSVWNDSDILAKIRPDLALSAKKTAPIAIPTGQPLMTSVVEARDIIGDVIVKAIETGGASNEIDSMAKTAAQKVNNLLQKAGEYGK